MLQNAAPRRALLFLAAAVFSAVMSDCVIENGAQLGLYGRSFADHDQRSVVCTLTAGLVLVIAAALVSLFGRLRPRLAPERDWLADAAHHIATTMSWRALPPALIVALLVRYAMESSELLQTTGHFGSGLSWLGGPLFIALAVHAACCALALFGLALFMRGLDRTLQALVSAIFALLAAFEITFAKRPVLTRRDRRSAVYRSLPLARQCAERAPPFFVAA